MTVCRKRMMKTIVKALNKTVVCLYKGIKFIGTLVLIAIFLVITAGIVSRYVFNKPFSWTEEVATFLMVYLCYISAFLTTVRKKHIVADFFISKASEKFQKAVGVFSKVLMLVFFAVLAVSVIKLIPTLVWRSGVLDIPRSAYYLPVWTMSLLMAFSVVVDMINDFIPGYNYMRMESERQKQIEREQEAAETAAMQQNMDSFMHAAGLDKNTEEGEG